MVTNDCKNCGEPVLNNRKYCNQKCRSTYINNNRLKKPCKECGNLYKPCSKHSKICNDCIDKSKQIARIKMRKENRNAKMKV